jgi:hypothetical protein
MARNLTDETITEVKTFFENAGRAFVCARHGWDTLALEFSDQLIVRLPRSPVAWSKMAREASILATIGDTLSIAVPRTNLMSSPFKASYHRRIDGMPLTPNLYWRMSPSKREQLACDLAEFVLRLE